MKACLRKRPAGAPSQYPVPAGWAGSACLWDGRVRESADTYYALRVLRTAQLDFDRAEAAYRKAIELRPDWNWAYNGLGILKHTQGKYAEAEAAFRSSSNWIPIGAGRTTIPRSLLRLTVIVSRRRKWRRNARSS